MKNVEISPLSNQTVPVDELKRFLLNLPPVETNRRGFNKEELQVRVPKELSSQLKLLSAAINKSDSSGPSSSGITKTAFRPDQLIVHLVTEFMQAHQTEIKFLTAGVDPDRDRINLEHELNLKRNQLLASWPRAV
jgi:hypothetical protein